MSPAAIQMAAGQWLGQRREETPRASGSHSVLSPGPACSGHWSEEDTDEEEEDTPPPARPRKEPKPEAEEADLQINVDEDERFVLPPSGQMEQDILLGPGGGRGRGRGQVHPEGVPGAPLSSSLAGPHGQAPDLQRIHKRIQDIVAVLRDFGTQREEGRSRAEYLSRLQKDLATYYSYGDFLLGKLMDLFPLSEVLGRRLPLPCSPPAPLLCSAFSAGQPDPVPAPLPL